MQIAPNIFNIGELTIDWGFLEEGSGTITIIGNCVAICSNHTDAERFKGTNVIGCSFYGVCSLNESLSQEELFP